MPDPTPPAAAAPGEHPLGPAFGAALGDMRFLGWVGLIYGVLTCLTVVGAIVGVPMIVAAFRVLEGVNRWELHRQDPGDAASLRAGFQEVGRGFRILKFLVVIQMLLTVLYLGALILAGGVGLLGGLTEA